MANLLSWAKKKVQQVEHGTQRAAAQVNPLDNGRTWQNPQGNAPQQSGPAPSAFQQVTHNGLTNMVGGGLVKPLVRSSMALNQGIGNLELKLAGRPTQNAQQYSGMLPGHAQKFTGYTGTKGQIAGDLITNTANVTMPGSSKAVTGAFEHVLPKVVPKIASRVLANSGVGAVGGGVNNVGTALSNGQIKTPKDIPTAFKQGAQIGAVLGAGGRLAAPLVKASATKVLSGAKTATPAVKAATSLTPRTTRNEQLTLQDMSNHLSGAKVLQGKSLSDTIAKSRQIASKHGENLAVGSPADRIEATNRVLDNLKSQGRLQAQTGAIGKDVTGASGDIPNIPRKSSSQGKLPQLPQAAQSKEAELISPSSGTTPQTLANSTIKQRGLTASIKSSQEISPELQKAVKSSYTTSNLAEKALNADESIKNLKKATTDSLDALSKPTRQLTDQDTANAIAVMKAHDAKGNIEQAQQIHDLLAEHGTTGGQFINAFKLLSNRTPDGMLFSARRLLKKAGVTLTKDETDQLKGHLDVIKSTLDGTPERDMAIHNMVQFVHTKIPSTAGDKLVNFWRAGLLTSPITTAGNILGNTGEAVVRNAWVNPIAAIADRAQSLVTGTRTKTMAGGQIKGTAQGIKQGAQYLKTGFDPGDTITKFEQKRDVNYGQGAVGKTVGGYVNTVYRALGAEDKPFRQAATSQAAKDLAKADAINLKLTGKARSDYIAKAMSNPDWQPSTFKTLNNSKAAGAFAVFGNETALGKVASLIKQPFTINGREYNGALRQFILPFSQVPASIAVRILKRSDLGAGEVINQVMRVRHGLPYDQRAVSEAIGNGTFGPAVIGAGYAIAKTGGITGNYPTDPKEQGIWKAQGKQANAVRIGNRWYSLNYMQPFGALLGIGAQIHKDEKAGKTPTEIISSATGTAAKSVESQSFLQGINGLLTAVNDPQRGAQKYIDQTASSIVPNFIRTTARATDPQQRETKGVGPSLKGTIPGVRETLPVKQDLFGRNMGAVDNGLNQAFNPLRPNKVKNDPIVNELARLQDAGQGIIPTQYDKTAFGGKKGTPISDQQVRDLQARVGSKTYQAYKDTINDPRYAALSDEQKKAALAKAGGDQGEAYKRDFATKNNIPLAKPASKKAAEILSGGKVDPFRKGKTSTGIDANASPDAQYKAALDSYKTNKDSYNEPQRIKAEANLNKLKVGSKYDKSVRDLYTLSKAQIYQYITTNKDGKKIADQLNAYDQDLYNSGNSAYLKFKNGIAPAAKKTARSSGGRSTGRKSTGRKLATAKIPKQTFKTPHLKTFKTKPIKVAKAKRLKLPKSKVAALLKVPLARSKTA